MIPKPKTLKGEALKFIDTNEAWMSDPLLHYSTVVKGFYEQKFEMDMIAEYFGNWMPYENMNKAHHYCTKDSGFYIYFDIVQDKPIAMYLHGWRVGVPRTLDEFISNCQQMDLPLEWI